MAQLNPVGGQLGDPAEAFAVGSIARQGGSQPWAGSLALLEGADAGGDAAIQFGQGHLQPQFRRPQADAAGLPTGPAATATEHLKHRHPQPLPQGGAKAGLGKLHRGEGGAAQHGLHRFSLQQIGDAPLHPRLPQPTYPDRPRCQTLAAEGDQGGLHQLKISGLEQGPIDDQAHPGPRFLAPVMGQGIGQGLGRRRRRLATLQQRPQHPQQLAEVGGPANAQAGGEGHRQLRVHSAQLRQLSIVLSRAGQHQQMSGGAAGAGLLGPVPQGLQAIAPVAPTAQQTHHHQLGLAACAGQVVVHHGRVGQARQVEGPQLAAQQFRIAGQQLIDRQQVGIGAAQQQHRCRRLLDQGPGIRLVAATGNCHQPVHLPILLVQ